MSAPVFRRFFPRVLPIACAIFATAILRAEETKPLRFGLVAKSRNNPVFEAARTGAQDAARELGERYHLSIEVEWRTPDEEDAQKQAEAIDGLVLAGVDGIAVSCSDASSLDEAIDSAVQNGVPVATFDSDAPKSRRFVCYATDDEACGQALLDELAGQMGSSGTIAILGGNEAAPNLQARIRGVKAALGKYPNLHLSQIVYHPETQADAASAVATTMSSHPDITGWVFVGGWPLYAADALPWTPGKVKCVSVGALPAELAYVRSGQVPVLFGQPCYLWGHRAVELLVDKVLFKKDPSADREVAPLQKVDARNVDEYARNWDKWLPK